MTHHEIVYNFLFQDITSGEPLVAPFQRRLSTSNTISVSKKSSLADVASQVEESGLSLGQDFHLFLKGKPIIVHEDDSSTWTVFSFSWVLDGGVSTDVRRYGKPHKFKWLPLKDIVSGKYDRDWGHPFSQAIQRVSLRSEALSSSGSVESHVDIAARVLEGCLQAMKYDFGSGARQMATTVLLHFHYAVSVIGRTAHGRSSWHWICMAAWHLVYNGRPSMNAAIRSNLLLCLSQMRSHKGNKAEMLEIFENSARERDHFSQRIGESFAKFVQLRFHERFNSSDGQPITISVLTLSSSIIKSALLAALRRCNIVLDVRILESRPLCEGAHMAFQLLQQAGDCDDRMKVTIATDASVAMMARDVDLVLLGADQIAENGDVSNKTGSHSAALCARALGNKACGDPRVVVVSGIEKVAKSSALIDDFIEEEDCGSPQIWRAWEKTGCKLDGELQSLVIDRRVNIKNVIFEWVPAECIDTYLNEDGEMTKAQIRAYSLYLQQLEDDVFGQL
ncbi:MAG: hypothetical protein GOMPHAMPRED_002074 [Gomphillus americanus]|uniref:Translation initiation factor eIF-2B subunit family protein n=1 Tax=Gomphillus americanus TaxID=1940652 RepID=A0A8H3IIU4_9LECA|nr:MAG: hypothetical protein GOMPHAMPRED_002074 [Gomphillus americanus]